jgi:hypothetical protein
MTKQKFIEDSQTVAKFIQYYCEHEHVDSDKDYQELSLEYGGKCLGVKLELTLCQECNDAFFYSYKKLQECPNEQKPSCRKCKEPCYDKEEWRLLAKMMRYSGMQLGFLKIKKIFTRSQ